MLRNGARSQIRMTLFEPDRAPDVCFIENRLGFRLRGAVRIFGMPLVSGIRISDFQQALVSVGPMVIIFDSTIF
jgi:hypothetical protein